MNITELRNGRVYVIGDGKRYQLSAMQVKILSLTFHSVGRGRKRWTIVRETLHEGVFGHEVSKRPGRRTQGPLTLSVSSTTKTQPLQLQ